MYVRSLSPPKKERFRPACRGPAYLPDPASSRSEKHTTGKLLPELGSLGHRPRRRRSLCSVRTSGRPHQGQPRRSRTSRLRAYRRPAASSMAPRCFISHHSLPHEHQVLMHTAARSNRWPGRPPVGQLGQCIRQPGHHLWHTRSLRRPPTARVSVDCPGHQASSSTVRLRAASIRVKIAGTFSRVPPWPWSGRSSLLTSRTAIDRPCVIASVLDVRTSGK